MFLYNYPTKHRNSIKIAIVYPNSYFVGMSNLGFQTIFHYLNMESNFKVARFFYDNSNEKKNFSPDNHFNLNQADIILFSQSFELDSLNLVNILLANNINPNKHKRNIEDPIVGAGGVFPTINPNIYKNILDVIFYGEIEVYLEKLINIIADIKNFNKNNIIDKLNFQYKFDLDNLPINYINDDTIPSHSAIITNNTLFKNYFLIEISRGCKFNCAFCLVSNIYKKFRYYNKDIIINLIKKSLKYTNKIGFISALTTEHPDIKYIIREVNNLGGIINFSSLRIDKLDDEFFTLIKNNKQNTLTVAPETACEDIKKSIGKNITNDKIINIIEKSLDYNIKKIKLYFMVGFPQENFETLDKNIELVKNIKDTFKKKAKKLKFIPQIIISINTLIPKPYTKLSSVNMIDIKEIKLKTNYIKKKLINLGNIKINIESPNLSRVQWIISKGDENVGNMLIKLGNENKNLKELLRFI